MCQLYFALCTGPSPPMAVWGFHMGGSTTILFYLFILNFFSSEIRSEFIAICCVVNLRIRHWSLLQIYRFIWYLITLWWSYPPGITLWDQAFIFNSKMFIDNQGQVFNINYFSSDLGRCLFFYWQNFLHSTQCNVQIKMFVD